MNKKKLLIRGAILIIAGMVVAVGGGKVLVHFRAENNVVFTDIHNKDLISRGEYVARSSDCAACHTPPGEVPYSGGLAMQSPAGTIYSTNITPDKHYGIGDYSYADFRNAVKLGIRKDGTPLYPAMPFPSYQIIPDKDIEAMYAYFMTSVQASGKKIPPPAIPWPLNMRWPMSWWQFLFSRERSFVPPQHASEQISRGAYLVEGPEHCGACHTPRNIFFQEKAMSMSGNNSYLSGAVMEGWYAKSLRGDDTGLGLWGQDDIEDFLKTGRTDNSAAYGMMAPVIEHSTRFLSDEDIRSIAVYLKSLPPVAGIPVKKQKSDKTTTVLENGRYLSDRGAVIYKEYCSVCHRNNGNGVDRTFPALNGNTSVITKEPSSVIQITLTGGKMPKNNKDPMTFAMPGFFHLSDEDIASVTTFIRQGWDNDAPVVSPEDVAKIREIILHKDEDIKAGERREKP
ncbi:TPA: cytochrome c [Salmonella enterica subsp. enterica serovar Stanley]|nr:cytochrome c [Salmonella enterica subsp. enterica serovar Stanley]